MLARYFSKGKLHYAWILLAACCIFELALQGVFNYCSGIFYVPVSSSIGVSVGAFSISATVYGLSMSLFTPIAGKLFSAKYFPYQMSAAAVVMCGIFALLSRATALWHWYAAMALIGICGSFLMILPVPILMNNWFDRNAGMAISIISAFSGLSGAIVSTLGAKMILDVGWRAAYYRLGLLSALIAIPAILLFVRYSPAQADMRPYGSAGEDRPAVLETEADHEIEKPPMMVFALLLVISALVSAFKSFYNHYSAFSVSIGKSEMTGAKLMSVIMIGTIVFRLLLGVLNDRAGIWKTLYFSLAIVTAALLCAAFLNASEMVLFLSSFAMGIGPAMMAVLPALLTREVCTREAYPTVFPMITMASTMTSALSNSIFGLLYDACSSYIPSMLLGVGLAVMTGAFVSRLFRQSGRAEKS